MNMIIFYCCLSIFGICLTLSQGKIFHSLRSYLKNKCTFFYDLITCPMCLSFWLGLIVGFFFGPFSWYNILNGFFYSATSWLLWCLTLYLGNGYDPSRVHNILFPDGIKIINNNEKE